MTSFSPTKNKKGHKQRTHFIFLEKKSLPKVSKKAGKRRSRRKQKKEETLMDLLSFNYLPYTFSIAALCLLVIWNRFL